MKTIKDFVNFKNNSFNFIRLCLSVIVAINHVGETTGHPLPSWNPLTGWFAVDCFFFLSGFLLTEGFKKRPDDICNYLWRRIRRIYPGFWVCLFLCAFLFYPLTAINLAYLPDLGNAVSYFFSNSTLAIVQPFLNGLWKGQSGFNNSLWSLWHEFICYFLLIIVVKLFIRDRVYIWVIAGISYLCFVAFGHDSNFYFTLYHVFPFFLTGIVFNWFQDRIIFNRFIFIISIIVCALAYSNPVLYLYSPLFIGFLLIGLGGYLEINIKHDFSYGIYLYHLPIANLIKTNGIDNFIIFYMVCGLMTFGFAYFSWFYVEKKVNQINLKFPLFQR